MMYEKVVIIIPTHNEESVIEETIVQVFEVSRKIPHKNIHILVFDSASTDKTAIIVKQLQCIYKRLHLAIELTKSGLGNAYHQAMCHALDTLKADIVIEFDADLSHQPKYLIPILKQMDTYDVVMGSRYVAGGEIPNDWGRYRKLISIAGNYIARFILTPKYKDFTSGFRATHQRALKKALPNAFLSNHYAYKLELLWLLHLNNARIIEYPISFIDRTKGQSKLPRNSIFDAIRVLLTLRFEETKAWFRPSKRKNAHLLPRQH